MYMVYCGDLILYDPRIKELTLESPSLQLEVNKSGTFTFTICSDHPYYNRIERFRSIIRVEKDGSLLFRGRVISEEIEFYGEKTLTCEGELSFLLDSRIRPFSYTGTPAGLFRQLLMYHNQDLEKEPEKQFLPGKAEDWETEWEEEEAFTVDSDTCESTFNALNKHLLDTFGGYLRVRHESDGVYLDYLKDFDFTSRQEIVFGENLLEYSREVETDSIITALVPYGAQIKDDSSDVTSSKKRVTIEEVNGGSDLIWNEEAVDRYGWILGSNTWNDVEDPGKLLAVAQEYLLEHTKLNIQLELSAVDLSQMDASYDDFRLGQYVFVTSEPHGMEREKYLITKLSLKLLEPAQNTLTLGKAYSTFTDETHKQNQQVSDLVTVINTVYADYITNDSVNSIIEDLKTRIDQTSEKILLTVSENYVTSDSFQEQSTQLSQTADQLEITFNSFVSKQEETNGSGETQFSDIQKYIRFGDGKITLGIDTDSNENPDENTLTCQIANDRLSFLQGNTEVAYISNNKLYITDVEIKNRLSMGKPENGYFDWLPRQNGNLSLVWRETGTEV